MQYNSVLNVKAVVAAFNQEKALVGAFSVLAYKPSDGTFSSTNVHSYSPPSLPWDWEQEGWLHVLVPGPDQECICSSVRPLYFIRTLKYVQCR